MKYLTILPILFCTNAYALEPYMGFGYTCYDPPSNGVWVQEELPHSIDKCGGSYSFGLIFDTPLDRVKVDVGYINLGNAHLSSWASGSDKNYLDWQAGEAELFPLSRHDGKHNTKGYFIKLQYHFDSFYLIGGAWSHKTDWDMDVSNAYGGADANGNFVGVGDDYVTYKYAEPDGKIQYRADDSSKISWIYGIGKEFGSFSLSYEIYQVRSGVGDAFSAFRGDAQNITLSYRF